MKGPGSAEAARPWDLASLVLFLGFACVAIWTLGDYGMSWDEWFRWRGGQEKLVYYFDLFAGRPADPAPRGAPDTYPGLFDLTLASLNEFAGLPIFGTGHSLSLAFGFLACLATWLLGRSIGGGRAGFFALAILLLVPRFYGHQFFNPKDIPFAATYAWALLALVWFLFALPRPSPGRTLGLGLAIGLALSTRIGALIVFGYLGLAGIWAVAREAARAPPGGRTRAGFDALVGALARCAVAAALAFAVLLPWWPYAHWNPVARSIEALLSISEYPWNGPVLYFGEYIRAADLPWHYLPVWITITIPPILVAALACGAVLAARRFPSLVRRWKSPEVAATGLLVFAVLFPVLYVLARDSILYDGMRHFLFVLPPLVVLGGLSLDRLFRRIRGRTAAFAAIAACVVLALSSVVPMLRLHPYQHTYFNPLAGGLAGAEGRFETDYWGTAKREAVRRLEAYLEESGFEGRPRVSSSPSVILSRYFFPEEWIPVGDPAQADFHVAVTRLGFHRQVEGETVVEVGREGAVFAVAVRLR